MGWNDMKNAPLDEEVLILDSDGEVRLGTAFALSCGKPLIKSDLDFGDASACVYWPDDLKAMGWLPKPTPPTRCENTIDLFDGAPV